MLFTRIFEKGEMIHRKQLVLSFLCFCFIHVQPVLGDEKGDGPAITGNFKGSYQHFFEETPGKPGQNHYSEAQLKINISGQLTDSVQYTINPLFQGHNEDWVMNEFSMIEDELQRPSSTFRELYFMLSIDEFELSIGKQVFSWGVADSYKITDVINPKDFMSVADSLADPDQHRIGISSISLFRYGSIIDFQALSTPIFVPNRLPTIKSRWETVTTSLDTTSDVVWERILPDREQAKNQGGIQFSSSSLVDGWDLAFNYYHGFSPVEVVYIKSVFPVVEIDLVYPIYHQFGFSFSTIIGDFEIHGEIASHESEVEKEDIDYRSYIFGFNYSWIDSLPDYLEKVNFILEFMDKEVTRERPKGSPYTSSGSGQPMDETANGRIEMVISEDTKFEILVSFNGGDEADSFVRAKWAHNLFDNLEIQFLVDAFDGPEDSYYGKWKKNNQASLITNYFF